MPRMSILGAIAVSELCPGVEELPMICRRAAMIVGPRPTKTMSGDGGVCAIALEWLGELGI